MFGIPLTTFKLHSCVAALAHLLEETLSPPLGCTCPFNKLVLDFLDIEAE